MARSRPISKSRRNARVYELGPELRQRITTNLRGFERRVVEPGNRRAAAVAITVVDTAPGDAAFLITTRAAGLRDHARQWALPGGRIDAGEDAAATARRELHEEVGLATNRDDVLGLLDDYPTRSGFVITPVVVWAGPGAATRANAAEVDAVHRVPLGDLDHEGSPRFFDIAESGAPVIQMWVQGHWIHAPTAAVLYQFRDVALHGRPTRVAHLEQPVWAWR
jgi:8-oxo-dGTP pyrophosphatase MutT (NUDIX family)